jgi:hypothetical protein
MSDKEDETQEDSSKPETGQTPAGTALPDPNVSINSEGRSGKP